MEIAFPKLTVIIPFWSRSLPWWTLAVRADAPKARQELRQALIASIEKFQSILERRIDTETQQTLCFEILVPIPGGHSTHQAIQDLLRDTFREHWASGRLRCLPVHGRPEERTWFSEATRSATGMYAWWVDPAEEWQTRAVEAAIGALHSTDLILLTRRDVSAESNLLGLALQDQWISDPADRLIYGSGFIHRHAAAQPTATLLQQLLEATAATPRDRIHIVSVGMNATSARPFQSTPGLIDRISAARELLTALKRIPRSKWIALFRPSALALLPNRR